MRSRSASKHIGFRFARHQGTAAPGWRALCLAYLAMTTVPVATTTLAAQEIPGGPEQEAVFALRSGDFDRARELFREVLNEARQAEDSARLYFYLGLADQQEALASESAEALLESAARNYERALELRRDFGASLNNLAQLYSQAGARDTAMELYARAAGLDDPRQAFYATNYANFLADAGMWQEASWYYAQAVEAQPENQQARQMLIVAYARHDPRQAVRELWDSVNRGMVNQALEGALELLGDADFDEKEQVLTIVAVTLGKSYYDPIAFLSGSAAERLSDVVDRRDIGEGAAGILRLHEGEDLDPGGYRWWGERGLITQDPEVGVWPRDGFRELIRSLGDRYRKAGATAPPSMRRLALQQAERYYTLSTLLSDEEPDPDAFLRIADIAIETGRIAELEKLAERYVPKLFYGKGEAYKRSQYRKIYRYHRALGVIYSHLKRWGNSHTPTSAIFQFEHALRAAQVHNSELRHEESGELLIVEPRLIVLLGEAYDSTGQPDKIFDPALETAEMYIAADDKDAARAVLSVLEGRELPASVRRRSDALRELTLRM